MRRCRRENSFNNAKEIVFHLVVFVQTIIILWNYLHFLKLFGCDSMVFFSQVTSIFMLPVLMRRSFSAWGLIRCLELGGVPLNSIRCWGDPVSSTNVSNECLQNKWNYIGGRRRVCMTSLPFIISRVGLHTRLSWQLMQDYS